MTALHALACQILAEAKEFWLPAKIARFGDLWRPLQSERSIRPERADCEVPRGEIRPDLIVTVAGRELAIEVWARHRSGRAKGGRYAALGLPAVEIDLSTEPNDACLAEIEAGVLKRAPRTWLYHPQIARTERELADTAARRRKREEEARARREAWLQAAAKAFLVRVRAWRPEDIELPPAIEEAAARVRATGLVQESEEDQPILPWFRIGPALLKLFLLDRYLLSPERPETLAPHFSAEEVVAALGALGALNPAWFSPPPPSVADWLLLNSPQRLEPPEVAVTECLTLLAGAGLFHRVFNSKWQATSQAQRWVRSQRDDAAARVREEAALAERDRRLGERLDSLQSALAGEGVAFDSAAWRRTALPDCDISPNDLVLQPQASTGPSFYQLLMQLDQVLALVEPDALPVEDLLGLPVETLQVEAVARIAARPHVMLAEVDDAMRPWLAEADPPGFDLAAWAAVTKLDVETTLADFIAVTSEADRRAARSGMSASESKFGALIADVLAVLERVKRHEWPIGPLYGLPLTGLVDRRAAEHKAAEERRREEELAQRARRWLPEVLVTPWLARPNPALRDQQPCHLARADDPGLAAAMDALNAQAQLLRKLPVQSGHAPMLLGWAYAPQKKLAGQRPLLVHDRPPYAEAVARQLREIAAQLAGNGS